MQVRIMRNFSMVQNNGRHGDVSVSFLPFCFSHSFSCLMQLIPYFPCPLHFILVRIFAGFVWILKSSGERARNCLVAERAGEQMKVMEISSTCGGKVWTVTVPAETALTEVKCTEIPAKRRDCTCIFRLLLLAKVHFEWKEGNLAWMCWRESWGVCSMYAHIHLRGKKGMGSY